MKPFWENINENIPDYVLNGTLLAYIQKKEMICDRYLIRITEYKRNRNNEIIDKKETELRAVIYPFAIKKDEKHITSNIAGYIEGNGKFEANMPSPGINRSFILKIDEHEFLASGRWDLNTFNSTFNLLKEETDNYKITITKKSYAGKTGCIDFFYQKYNIYIMPVLYQNKEKGVPFIAVMYDVETGIYLACAAQEELRFKELDLAAYWDNDILKIFQKR